MQFLLGLLACFPFLVKALNCNPAESSAILWQCFQDNNSHVSLLSGHNYTISNKVVSYPISTSLTINSTESNTPAVLVLQNIGEEGLFTDGKIVLNNLDIRGEGPGVFLKNVKEIEINNCSVRNYDITDSSTGFIHGANKIQMDSTSFYNNTVHSTTSSTLSPAYMIGTNIASSNWNLNISDCTFARNSIDSSTSMNVINLFFFLNGLSECTTYNECQTYETEIPKICFKMHNNIMFHQNRVYGSGSAFAWVQTSFENYFPLVEHPITIEGAKFTENTVHQSQHNRVNTCGMEFGVFCSSFFIFSPSFTWATTTANFLMTDTIVMNNIVDVHANFLQWFSISGNVNISNSSFDNNNMTMSGAYLIYLNEPSGSITINNSSFDNNTATGSSAAVLYMCDPSGSININNSSFDNNTATDSAKMINMNEAHGSITIGTSSFDNNKATHEAYMIYSYHSSGTITISNSSFDNNTPTNGAGVIFLREPFGSVTISKSSFDNNNATISGAGVIFVLEPSGSVTISDSSFNNNNTPMYYTNLLYYTNGKLTSSLLMEFSTFTNLHSMGSTSSFEQNLFYIKDSHYITFTNCTFSQFESQVAPFYYESNNQVTMNNCTFDTISDNENNAVIYLNEQTNFAIVNASFVNPNGPEYDIYGTATSEISTCTWEHFAPNQEINTNLDYTCTKNSYDFGYKCKGISCWSTKNQVIFGICMFVLLYLSTVGFFLRKRIYKVYHLFQIFLENRRKANMRENQLKVLISAFGGGGNETEEIESILTSTLSEIIVPFDTIKLDGGEIARGGSGIVMKGTMLRPEKRTVAVKVIQSQIAGEMQELQEELSMLYSLTHPNIISFIGVSFYQGAIMIIQDYCPQNLFQYIKENGKFTEINPFLDIILTILDTLCFLHGEKNIAHRDLKPENILLDKDNHPKICDLGMAKFVGKGNETVYRGNGGNGMGTPGYMPPEVILIKKGERYEPKYWDVFSTAMIIYFMWTGKHPLLEEFENAFAINDEISKGTRPILPTSIPINLRNIIRRMWDQDHTKRLTVNESSGELYKLYKISEVLGKNEHIQLNPLTHL